MWITIALIVWLAPALFSVCYHKWSSHFFGIPAEWKEYGMIMIWPYYFVKQYFE